MTISMIYTDQAGHAESRFQDQQEIDLLSMEQNKDANDKPPRIKNKKLRPINKTEEDEGNLADVVRKCVKLIHNPYRESRMMAEIRLAKIFLKELRRNLDTTDSEALVHSSNTANKIADAINLILDDIGQLRV